MRERFCRRASVLLLLSSSSSLLSSSPSSSLSATTPINQIAIDLRAGRPNLPTSTLSFSPSSSPSPLLSGCFHLHCGVLKEISRAVLNAFAIGNVKCIRRSDDNINVSVPNNNRECAVRQLELAALHFHSCKRQSQQHQHRLRELLAHQFAAVAAELLVTPTTLTTITTTTSRTGTTTTLSGVGVTGVVCGRRRTVDNKDDHNDHGSAEDVDGRRFGHVLLPPPAPTTIRINSDDGIHHGLCLFQR